MTMRTCDLCGANLDPCERCDCQDTKKAAPGDSNTEGGAGEKILTKKISQDWGAVNG